MKIWRACAWADGTCYVYGYGTTRKAAKREIENGPHIELSDWEFKKREYRNGSAGAVELANEAARLMSPVL